MPTTQLPRWTKDSVLTADDMNRLAEAIERADSWEFDGSSGLQMMVSQVGRTVSFAGCGLNLAHISLSTTLPAGDGKSKLGHGQGKVLTFTAGTPGGNDNGTLAADSDASTVDVYNLIDSPIISGSTILAAEFGSAWHYILTICSSAGS